MAARQSSFNAGELSPELRSQLGSQVYARGARSLLNFLPLRQGAAMSRPGMDYLGAVKGGGLGENASTSVRLVPFVYSDTDTEQNYVLEFGYLYIRFWRGGALLMDGASPLEVVTTYTVADLPYLNVVQSGDVLTICCPGHAPAELSRTSDTSWTLADVDFSRPAPSITPLVCHPLVGANIADADHPARDWVWAVTTLTRDTRGVLTESAPVRVASAVNIDEWDSGSTYASGSYATYQGHLYRSLAGSNTNQNPKTATAWWALDDTGSSISGTYTAPGTSVVAPDKPVSLLLRTSTNTSPNAVGQRIYRGRGNVLGYIGDANGGVFIDVGDEPDFTVQPPQGKNPFSVWYDIPFTFVTEHPAAVAFFEERRVFARTDERPAYVFASATGDYANFDDRLIPTADESLKFELASRRREEIRSLLEAGEKLLAFSNGGVWAIGGSGGPLSFDNIQALKQSGVGASWVPPVDIDGLVLYAGATSGVHVLEYQQEQRRFGRQDVSLVAQHLHRGHTIKAWAYAEQPWSVLWAVRDDGVLLSLTVDQSQQVAAWAHHETDGVVESICSIPEGTEDAVYLVVRRTVNGQGVRYVERMRSRVLKLNEDGTPAVLYASALDCAITQDGGPPFTTINNLEHLEGEEIWVVAGGNVEGPLTVTDGSVTLSTAASVAYAGLRFIAQFETLDYPAAAERQKTVTAIAFEVLESRGLKVGQDEAHLEAWVQRTVADSYSPVPYATTRVRMPVLGTWSDSVHAVLRQEQPLPVTVTAVILEVDVGG